MKIVHIAILSLCLAFNATAGDTPKETAAQFKARLEANLHALDAKHQKAAALRQKALISLPTQRYPIYQRRYNRLDQLEDELFWLQLELDSR